MPATIQRTRSGRRPKLPNKTNTARYSSTRSVSTNARPGASDHAWDSSTHTANSASSPAAIATERPKPRSGRSARSARAAMAIRTTQAAVAVGPAWNPPPLAPR